MPHSFFVLFRHFLRVDGVLFRLHDVRLFHRFGAPSVVRETAGWEASYEAVQACTLPPPYTDLSLLSDPGWVHQQLSAPAGRKRPAAVRLDAGQKPWPGLGRRLEVLDLQPAAAEAAAAAAAVAGTTTTSTDHAGD
jgi:type 2A phosphatase activator TIP41